MELRGTFRVKEIKKKTSAEFFKHLKVGDDFELVYSLTGGYKSAPTINIYKDGKLQHTNNALQLHGNLSKFALEQLRDY